MSREDLKRTYSITTSRTREWANGEPIYKMPFRGGFGPQGRFSIHKVEVPEDDYVAWYWQDGDEDVVEHYNTRWEAVDACCREILGL